MPRALFGARIQLTSMEDARNVPLSRFLTFEVNQGSRVWIAHDDRLASRPKWFASWTAAGVQLTVDDGAGL